MTENLPQLTDFSFTNIYEHSFCSRSSVVVYEIRGIHVNDLTEGNSSAQRLLDYLKTFV